MVKKILKRIWAVRKGYLTRSAKHHYAQFGEDIILKELLNTEKRDGFFVDVGCYHPKKHSNTYALYKKGWTGINIDMEEDKIMLFNMIRRRDHNVLSPVSDKKEEVTLYRYSKYGLESTIDDQYMVSKKQKPIDQKKAYTRTLNDIIGASPYHDQQIDVLSIDVEGKDFAVLCSLDFDKYRPKIIIIEDYSRDVEKVIDTEVYQLLKKHSYILRSWVFYSLIFVLPEADVLKDREYCNEMLG